MLRRSFCVVLAVLLLCGAVEAGPFVRVKDTLSLKAAIARAGRTGGPKRIGLESGTYRLSRPLVLDEKVSGTPKAPFVLAAAPGARAILSGSVDLTALVWTRWKNGIWQTRLSGRRFQRLWLGKQLLHRARYPNYDPAKLTFGGTAADAIAPERIARWKYPAGGVFYALHASLWGGVYQKIKGKNADGTLAFGPVVGNNRISPPHPVARMVENIFEELDSPGEWYLDGKAGLLYYMPRDGKRPPASGFHAGASEELIRIAGTRAPVHDIAIKNLVFEDTEPTILKATEPLLRSDWTFYRAGAVAVENAERVDIAGSDLRELGGNGIVVSGHARHIAISGNHLWSIGGTAIAFVGRPEAVLSALFEYGQSLPLSAIDRTPGPKSDDYPADSVAQDNLIHDIGLIDKNAAGVELSMSARIAVDHNSIYRGPRAGINVGDGTWGGHVITNNDVFDTVRESGDHGAFNSWGRDRYWHPDRAEMDRRVALEPTLVTLDAREPIILKHNRLRCDHGWDIDLDDGATNYRIEDNLLLAGGIKLREGFYRMVQNNILVNNSFHPHVWFQHSGDVFEHNIVMTAYQPVRITDWGKQVDFNLFVNAADLKQAQAAGTDAHSLAGNPEFSAPAHGDFSVARDSPAIGIGFRNFAMNDFGVRSARLRRLAETPPMPVADLNLAIDELERPRAFAGMTIKSVQTLGEQSAAGLASREGVIVASVDASGTAERAGLKAGDVITAVAADNASALAPTPTAASFVVAARAQGWRGSVVVAITRNQATRLLTLSLQ